ncbi:MAG: lysylphosphatidylglycerol synthase transmembrane domain-containing protein [Chitinophagales bacterium]
MVKKYLKLLLKLCLTLLALYLVYRKIDLQLVKEAFLKVHFGYLLMAFVAYNASKIISAFRLNHFFKSIEVELTNWFNLKLYYIGMFYNLFLPGGIGGDGYKIFVLKQQSEQSVKSLVSAALLDRVSGLAALCFLALILFLYSSGFHLLQDVGYLVYLGIIGIYPIFYIAIRFFFKNFLPVFKLTSLLSIGVQGVQIGVAFCILQALHVQNGFVDYLTLFLVSSVVAAIPFTIGGIGAREIVFVYGNTFFGIETNIAVTFSLIFFLINALSSFIGVFLSINPDEYSAQKKPQQKAVTSSTL